jgi:hypothetical protein
MRSFTAPCVVGRTLREVVAIIVVFGFLGLCAWGLAPRGRGYDAWHAKCVNNLRQIYFATLEYDNALPDFSFPVAKARDGEIRPRAHDSLQMLLDSRFGQGLSPELFKCPAGDAELAEQVDGEKLVLDEDTLDYAWTIRKARPEDQVPLASDKYIYGWGRIVNPKGGKVIDQGRGGHQDVVYVLLSDGTVVEMDQDDENFDPTVGLPVGLGR